ncbi:hypothetical protein PPN31114_03503 [Pandoraea pneumonica]|uniref:Uncharacterized protein n=1 Tax=Pandoraea pneumonica TaxID=2508299 RepID=A0A5E4WT74_9BURK|nr:hypothetical protein [Pandoraea pneumonica]VVE28028.1 hypothetical protein PPN31114_03503 [Pandoraea pneumonica]
MPSGFRILDEQQRTVFDGSARVPRVLGIAYADGVNPGSVWHPAFATGDIYFAPQLALLFSDVRAYKRHPVISDANRMVSWTYPTPQGTQYGVPVYIVYGVY